MSSSGQLTVELTSHTQQQTAHRYLANVLVDVTSGKLSACWETKVSNLPVMEK